MRVVLKVRRKGVVILPKRLREASGIREGDEVLAETKEGKIILEPLRPRIVDVDPDIIDRLLEEESRLEERKIYENQS